MGETQEAQTKIWTVSKELPREVLEAWHKPGNVISPLSIIATVDADGKPRTAPFGSLRAMTPHLLYTAPH